MSKPSAQQVTPSDVLERLREMIVSRNLQPGERLPSERSLATRFSVGRPAIREATKALQILDVLDSRHGDGTFIKSLAALSGGWPTKVELTQKEFNLIDLLEVRQMYEPTTAALAAARHDKQHLDLIEREVIAMEKNPDDRNALVRHDYLFHEQIMRAAGNHVLQGLNTYLTPMLLKSRKMTGWTTIDTRSVIQQHRVIFEAIRLRNPDMAAQAMVDHLRTTGLDLLAYHSRAKRNPTQR